MSKATFETNIQRIKDPDERLRFMSLAFQELRELLNNGLDFQTNFNGKVIDVTFTTAGANVALNHGLGRVVSRFVVLKISTAIIIYDGSTAPTSDILYLRANGAGTASIYVGG